MTHLRPRIITFTRRSDPAFFVESFRRALDAGFIDVPNPFSGKLYRVSLLPEHIILMTLWTKNPSALMPLVDELCARGISCGLLVSVTGYPRSLEADVPAPREIAQSLLKLSSKLSPDALVWRYDPIIFTGQMNSAWHLNNFSELCSIWKGNTRRVIFSLAHIDGSYSTVRRSIESACSLTGDHLMIPQSAHPDFASVRKSAITLCANLASIARNSGIDDVGICCSPKLTEDEKQIIPQSACLSRDWLSRIVPSLPQVRTRGTRKEHSLYAACSCLESVDIGINGSCNHGCVYCYANRNRNH